jgi:hypothetical protein
MLPDASVQRLAPLLAASQVSLAYYVHPLPRGILSASRGGLALHFASTTTSSQRYEQLQRVRFQLMGVMPTGHTETISLNDSHLSISMAAVEKGMLVYCADEAERLRFETMLLTQILDFRAAARRFLGNDDNPVRQ